MNTNNGILLSGTMLRVIDSYVVTANTSGTVNWTQANSSIATMMTNFYNAGLLAATITTACLSSSRQSLAQITYTYKRLSLHDAVGVRVV